MSEKAGPWVYLCIPCSPAQVCRAPSCPVAPAHITGSVTRVHEAKIDRLHPQRAAMIWISTLNAGAASRASTVARAGVWPAGTQASHTQFISLKVEMSAR